MILVDRISKYYGAKRVLNDISFNVQEGDFLSIVGHSGAGKTTLINTLIGAEPIESGRIVVDGLDVNKLTSSGIQEYRQNIGIVFQDFKLLDYKTIFENVAFALEVSGFSRDYINQKTVEALKITGLEKIRNNLPHQVSGGEKQRVAIARAFVHAPKILIADEPTGNLDPENAISIAKLLQKINKTGTTVILSTHNKEIVNLINQRVIVLAGGQIVKDIKKSGYPVE